MAISILECSSVAQAAEPVEPRLTALVTAAEEALAAARELGSDGLDGLDDEALGGAIAGLARVEARSAQLRLSLTGEADRRQVAEQTAETGTDAWVARLTGSTREQAAGGLRLARLLGEKYEATREAFAAGRLGFDQVRVIVNAAEQAPAEATAGQVAQAEQWLVDRATGAGTRTGRALDAKRLRQTARRMFTPVDPDRATRHEAILLGRETRTAEAETFLTLHDNGDGSYSGRFRIPELHGHLLTKALHRLTAPRRLSHDRAGRPVVDVAAPGGDWGTSTCETWGGAWCELIEHLPTRELAANGCEILVRINLDALLTGLGTAGLDTGIAITAREARRLACNAGLVPAVLDGDSMPLDLGRTRRLHSRSQRRALALLHDTCAIAGCQRPFAWCEIHHPHLSWGHGGATDLHNGLPLCGHHHRRAHDPTFNLRHRPDGEWTFHRRT